MGEFVGGVAALIGIAVVVGAFVALAGLAAVVWFVQRWRRRADARLDRVSAEVLEMAVQLSGDVRAQGHDARVRLIKAANAAMTQQAGGRRW